MLVTDPASFLDFFELVPLVDDSDSELDPEASLTVDESVLLEAVDTVPPTDLVVLSRGSPLAADAESGSGVGTISASGTGSSSSVVVAVWPDEDGLLVLVFFGVDVFAAAGVGARPASMTCLSTSPPVIHTVKPLTGTFWEVSQSELNAPLSMLNLSSVLMKFAWAFVSLVFEIGLLVRYLGQNTEERVSGLGSILELVGGELVLKTNRFIAVLTALSDSRA